jgi:hypothetical protein
VKESLKEKLAIKMECSERDIPLKTVAQAPGSDDERDE